MEKPSEKQNKSLLSEGTKAQKALEGILNKNNIHMTEEFIEIFKEKFSNLFRTSMATYMRKQDLIEETSKVVNYLESITTPNYSGKFDLNELSPTVKELFFRAINQAYLEVSRKNKL